MMVILLLFALHLRADIIPTFRGELLDGKRVSVQDYLKPNRFLFISFWATWCGPCLTELKTLKQALEKDPSLKIDVLSVNVDGPDSQSDIEPTLRKFGFQFPVLKDSKKELLVRFYPEANVPFSMVIDSERKIRKTFTGYHATFLDEVKNAIH